MEKTINIDGKDYKMKSTAANLLKYKAQFGRDLLEDIDRLQQAQRKDGSWNVGMIDLSIMYDMVWLLIKAADPSLPEPLAWLDSLDSFPIRDAAAAAITLYVESMQGTETGKNV